MSDRREQQNNNFRLDYFIIFRSECQVFSRKEVKMKLKGVLR